MEAQRERAPRREQVRRRPARGGQGRSAQTDVPRLRARRGRRPRHGAARATARRSRRCRRARRARSCSTRTPFYAECGGQVGDARRARLGRQRASPSTDTQKRGAAFAHVGRARGGRAARRRSRSQRAVDQARRRRDRAQPLGHAPAACGAAPGARASTCTQKGSLVAPDRLRFDFSHFQPVDRRGAARASSSSSTPRSAPTRRPRPRLMDYDAAVAAGAMALFGEKYDERRARAARSATSRPSCAAARTSSAPATSACSRSSARPASPPACGASRR